MTEHTLTKSLLCIYKGLTLNMKFLSGQLSCYWLLE